MADAKSKNAQAPDKGAEDAEVRQSWLDAKKRASDLQSEVDRFAVERKNFQDIAEENEKLKAELAESKELAASLASELSDAKGEIAKADKALAKADGRVEAARKIKEGLAELG